MNERQEKVVGVVAGAGPFAGIDLLGKIARETRAIEDQDHLTVISISQPNRIPDRTEYLLGKSEVNPALALALQIRKLEKAGANVVGIPCNTAHAAAIFGVVLDELQHHGCKAKVLNMIQEVARYLHSAYPGSARIGLLATTGTYHARTYSRALELKGFEVVLPPPSMQEMLIQPSIYDPEYGIKACGYATKKAKTELRSAVHYLKGARAEALILGCTELPLAFDERRVDGMSLVDPTLILARALIREANPDRLKPESVPASSY
jgi:aspartate racemase